MTVDRKKTALIKEPEEFDVKMNQLKQVNPTLIEVIRYYITH